MQNSTIGFLELSVNVEEMENLTSLRCAPETEGTLTIARKQIFELR